MTPKSALIQAEITTCLFKALQESPLPARRKRALLHKLAEGNINLRTVSEIVEETNQRLMFRLEPRPIAGGKDNGEVVHE